MRSHSCSASRLDPAAAPLDAIPSRRSRPIRTARRGRRLVAAGLPRLPLGLVPGGAAPACSDGLGLAAGSLAAGSPAINWSGLWAAVTHGDAGDPIPGGRGDQGGDDAEVERLRQVEALVRLAQAGDTEAFGRLYERYVDIVYRFVYVRVGSVHLAQDITSETFIKAMRSIDRFQWQGKDIAAWFVTIARNLVIDAQTSAQTRREHATADMRDHDTTVAGPDGEVLDQLRDERLLAAVRSLKPEHQDCIVLRFLDGLSLAETAEVLGKKENAVKQLQLRAVRALQRALDGEEL